MYETFKTRHINTGKTVTIYEVASFANKAFIHGVSMENIVKGFSGTRIHPYNRNIFNDEDFLSSYVTDMSNPHYAETLSAETHSQQILQGLTPPKDTIENSPNENFDVPSMSQGPVLSSPVQVSPCPKAPSRKKLVNLVEVTAIITETPEKDSFLEEKESDKRKKKQTSAVIKNK